jgi:hypothetical protein
MYAALGSTSLQEKSMSALKVEGEERVRAEDAVEIIDCGRASERTKGSFGWVNLELSTPPFNWLFPI